MAECSKLYLKTPGHGKARPSREVFQALRDPLLSKVLGCKNFGGPCFRVAVRTFILKNKVKVLEKFNYCDIKGFKY